MAQAIIEVAIVFTVFGLAVVRPHSHSWDPHHPEYSITDHGVPTRARTQANVPVPVGKAKTVPVYLAIFIMGQYVCGVAGAASAWCRHWRRRHNRTIALSRQAVSDPPLTSYTGSSACCTSGTRSAIVTSFSYFCSSGSSSPSSPTRSSRSRSRTTPSTSWRMSAVAHLRCATVQSPTILHHSSMLSICLQHSSAVSSPEASC